MTRHSHRMHAAIVAYLLITLLPGLRGVSKAIDYTSWGAEKAHYITRNFSPETRYCEFTPASNPGYKNKIMSYIIALSDKFRDSISIVKTKTNPERDFLFVKNRLYSISEIYESLTDKKAQTIIQSLTASFGAPVVEKGASYTQYSYATAKTRVMARIFRREHRTECKIYYYSTDIFKRLMVEE